MRQVIFFIMVSLFLTACINYTGSAPVRDINTQRVGQTLYYFVEPGETLYSVAWRYELDYLRLAQLNGLSAPYAIHPGERLRLSGVPVKSITKKKPMITSIKKPPKKIKSIKQPYESNVPVQHWLWPAKGKVVQGFSRNNKGINIKGNYEEPIVATAVGEVVYAGRGIRGYGNLLIIKHNRTYLTAYAYNSQLLVKNGAFVKAGQQIAKMGMTNGGRVLLHFEVRKLGKPVNPLSYLT